MNHLEQRLERLKRQHYRLKWFFTTMVVVFVCLAWVTFRASYSHDDLVQVGFLGIMLYGGMIRLVSMKDLIEVLEDVMSDRLGLYRGIREPSVPVE